MEEVVKPIKDTNASYRRIGAGDAKNTDLFLDIEHYQLFEGCGVEVTVRFNKVNLTRSLLLICSFLPLKFDQSSIHKTIYFSKNFILDQLAMLDALFVDQDGNPCETILQSWEIRINTIKKNGEIDKRFYFKGLLKDFKYVGHDGEERDGKFTIRNYLLGGISELHMRKGADGVFDVLVENRADMSIAPPRPIVSCSPLPLQQIFYGAPGTGKSRAVSELTEGRDVVRTTFHPDSDYSTFVGVYKPATKDEETTDAGGVARRETKIVYEFVPQAFLKAYAKAWKKLVGAAGGAPEPQFLVVEEINRGNCAQVFGDLFQLLDRAPDGFSAYPIEADTDLCRHLRSEFEGCAAPWLGADADRALRGETLLLPPNLHIWATMNTSDQSLFPVDSAFKRRWDWHYTPIYDAALGWVVRAGARRYDWWQFLEKINDNIAALTSSEDKKLGYFFCKATDGVISAETFVGKVLFYLWNDVFKDYGTDSPLFDAPDGRRLTFSDFYAVEGGAAKADETKVEILMRNLGVEALPDEESGDGL